MVTTIVIMGEAGSYSLGLGIWFYPFLFLFAQSLYFQGFCFHFSSGNSAHWHFVFLPL